MNIYYDPEKFGGEIVGEVEYSSGSYEFDKVVLWQFGDQFMVGADQGCSCPTPFEKFGIDNLSPIKSVMELTQWLDSRRQSTYVDHFRKDWVDMAEVELVSRYNDRRPKAFS